MSIMDWHITPPRLRFTTQTVLTPSRSPSPLDYLAAFALVFLGCALLAARHCKYVGKVRRDTHPRVREIRIHA
ncbi:hypothetical protein DF021_08445 [Burkholderia stagnalis]|uniref:Uncharacterized protein n=1 Tax=Burkholderia stagnalis TaxID=1503054 RepID=A0ABX9YT11_9BURK|nr:hypothetical protein DF158_09335 [Burkholderia stagnalis]RQQ72275.1 hypothetical protein DF137_07650 [Burkholderia stagnalis]RQQ73557.1 hypothetical protein DF139_06750 [Burkholderia stagnalis]RQQ85407.1 hypothetical protein DF138_04385 [Burkholderia stagnalis]RQQ92875.1 hypothetical protein DF134_10645 [Burkholderia stagnalis]